MVTEELRRHIRNLSFAPGETLSTGIVKSDSSKRVWEKFQVYSGDGILFKLVARSNTLLKDIAADAAEGFGQKLVDNLPAGLYFPLHTSVELTTLGPTGLSATAGEVSVGTTLGTGANATAGAQAAGAEDWMEGTTLSNNVAGTALVSEKGGFGPTAFDHGATTPGGAGRVDATAGTVDLHVNLFSTWNQTAAEDLAFSLKLNSIFLFIGADFGIE
jgi:hypothetical protein